MRFSQENLELMVDRYVDEAKSNYIQEVKNIYLDVAKEKYKDFSNIDQEILSDLFYNSFFHEIMGEDANYAMERYPEYWANHIIEEIESIVDFEELRNNEIQRDRSKIKSEIQEIELGNLIKEATKNSIWKVRQPSHVKDKRKFMALNGVKSIIINSSYIEEIPSTYLSDEISEDKNKLAMNMLEKDINLYGEITGMKSSLEEVYLEEKLNGDEPYETLIY